jgi:hypothetical protein
MYDVRKNTKKEHIKQVNVLIYIFIVYSMFLMLDRVTSQNKQVK